MAIQRAELFLQREMHRLKDDLNNPEYRDHAFDTCGNWFTTRGIVVAPSTLTVGIVDGEIIRRLPQPKAAISPEEQASLDALKRVAAAFGIDPQPETDSEAEITRDGADYARNLVFQLTTGHQPKVSNDLTDIDKPTAEYFKTVSEGASKVLGPVVFTKQLEGQPEPEKVLHEMREKLDLSVTTVAKLYFFTDALKDRLAVGIKDEDIFSFLRSFDRPRGERIDDAATIRGERLAIDAYTKVYPLADDYLRRRLNRKLNSNL